MMNTDNVHHVPIGKLTPHPQNPRISVREDVVESIRKQIEASGSFPAEHALLVRPLDGGYQIVSGHHRLEAAKRAQLDTVPCWVRPLDDETAFLQLALSNAQGELTPLEIGLHALQAVPPEKGGRGKKGGLSEYAERLGRSRQYICELRDAASVYSTCKLSARADSLVEKAKHLAAIRKTEEAVWPFLVEGLQKNDWSLEETQKKADKVSRLEILGEWAEVFLPHDQVVTELLRNDDFSPRTVSALCGLADSTLRTIDAQQDAPQDQRDAAKADFVDWLRANTGGASWNLREVTRKQQELVTGLRKCAQALQDAWIHGDWRDHYDKLEDGSVSLLLTDPPYGIDLQGKNRRNQRAGLRPEKLANDGSDAALGEMREAFIAFASKLNDAAHVLCFCHWRMEPRVREVLADVGFEIRSLVVWSKNNHGTGDLQGAFAPKHELIIHAVKGDPTLFSREPDVLDAGRVATDRHPTEKPVDLLTRLIGATTVQGELVADPFGGVGSTVVAARDSGRRGWGCEIDETYFAVGRKRLADE